MTSSIAKPTAGIALRERIPARTELPDTPPELARALRMTEGEASDRYLPRPGEVAIAQAAALIPAYAAADEPTARDAIKGWLDRVSMAVVNAPLPEAHKAGLAAFFALSGDLPRLCWTMETWQAFLRRGPDARFWPAVSDVDLFLRPIADKHRAKLATLRRIAAAGSAPDKPEPPPVEEASEAARMTMAEREAVVAAIRAKHGLPPSGAGRSQREPTGDRPPIPGKPVDAATLQAFRARCRALLNVGPLPITTTEGS